MPIPVAFDDAMRRREFWVDYLLTEGAEWPEFKRGCQSAAPVGGGYEIVVALTDLLYETNLYLRRPGAKKLSWMGRNDLAEWPRDVLRWEETLLINEAAARMDAEFAASDVLLVLLYLFTPLTDEDDRKQIYARMRRAFASLGVLSTSVINRCARHCLSDATGNIWWQHPKHGWVLKQNPAIRPKVSRSWHPGAVGFSRKTRASVISGPVARTGRSPSNTLRGSSRRRSSPASDALGARPNAAARLRRCRRDRSRNQAV